MNPRIALAVVFLALGGLAVHRQLQASPAASLAAVTALRAESPPDQGGSFPARWNAGVNCGVEPPFQVHPYNEDLYIIRQSKCGIFEAPFLYLIFGEEKALLMDTGANPNMDVEGTVRRAMQEWAHVHDVPMPPLIVAHTHGHGDHIAGDNQFINQPYVETLVSPQLAAVKQFWGFQDWPNDIQSYDLGNRILDVIPSPGHQSSSITLYDRRTHLLLTGDIVYPGHLFVFSQAAWPVFEASIERLIDFARRSPVEWVLGCHIEMSKTPFVSYPWGAQVHPDEHVLQFRPRKLLDIQRAANSMNGDPQCQIFDEFVIHPVYRCTITWNG